VRKDLIADIIFIWDYLRDIEEDSFRTFHIVSKSIIKVCSIMDLMGIPCNEENRRIQRLGVLHAIRLIAFITQLRKQGVTLESFLRKYKDVIKGIDNEYVRRYIITKYSDIIYP